MKRTFLILSLILCIVLFAPMMLLLPGPAPAPDLGYPQAVVTVGADRTIVPGSLTSSALVQSVDKQTASENAAFIDVRWAYLSVVTMAAVAVVFFKNLKTRLLKLASLFRAPVRFPLKFSLPA